MKYTRLYIIGILVLGLLFYSGNYTRRQQISKRRYSNLEIFQEYKMSLPEKEGSVTIVAVGDIMLSRYVDLKMKQKEDPYMAFRDVKWFFQDGDIVFGNLECPLTPGRDIGVPEMVLRANPELASVLKHSGFDILSLANNHIFDFGEKGFLDTIKALRDADMEFCGATEEGKSPYKPVYMEASGVKLAFLSFTDKELMPDIDGAKEENCGVAFLDKDRIATAINEAKENADFIVVYLHGGTEYAPEPDKAIIEYSHLAIDSGADLVLGSHPHVVQKIEEYKGKYILYSLGNFIFDQLWSDETRESIMAKIHICGNKVEKVELLPVFIDDNCFPLPLKGEKGQKVIDRLRLKLKKEIIPFGDGKKQLFSETEQYVFYPENYQLDYRRVKNLEFDLDNDGIMEKFMLKDGKIEIRKDNKLIWYSPEEWWVDYFFIGDADNDGINELCLLVWKVGSFGPNRPFWIEEEDTSFRNHLFLFKLIDGEIKPVWQSSNLDKPNFYATLVDYNDDGKNELLVIEGSYTDFKLRKRTIWQWNGWGFSLLHSIN